MIAQVLLLNSIPPCPALSRSNHSVSVLPARASGTRALRRAFAEQLFDLLDGIPQR